MHKLIYESSQIFGDSFNTLYPLSSILAVIYLKNNYAIFSNKDYF